MPVIYIMLLPVITLLLYVLVWVICCWFAYGVAFAYFYYEFPNISKAELANIALSVCWAGPVSLVMALFFSKPYHGMLWRHPN